MGVRYHAKFHGETNEFPTLGPSMEHLGDFHASSCIIYDQEVNLIVCGFGLGLLVLALLFIFGLGIFAAWKFTVHKCLKENTFMPDFRRKLLPYLAVPVSKLPRCLLLELCDSIGSERFQTWKSLASMHQVDPGLCNSRDGLIERAEVTLKKIWIEEGNSFNVETLLRDLKSFHREDTLLRITTHIERCLACTESLSFILKHGRNPSTPSSRGYGLPTGSLESINSSIYYPSGKEPYLLCPNYADDDGNNHISPVAISTEFWTHFGHERIGMDRRLCILKIVYQEFQLHQCSLLKAFSARKKWPKETRELQILLQGPSPAERFFDGFLAKKPDYTYAKLKRDLECLDHYSLLLGIVEHYNAGTCGICHALSSSGEYEDYGRATNVPVGNGVQKERKTESVADSGLSRSNPWTKSPSTDRDEKNDECYANDNQGQEDDMIFPDDNISCMDPCLA